MGVGGGLGGHCVWVGGQWRVCLFHLLWVLLCRCALRLLFFVWGRRPGVRPGGRGTFLCFAKAKYPKERRPEVRATSWFPALLAPGGGPAKLAAIKQTRGLIPLSLRCSALPHGTSGIGYGRACGGALLPLRSGGFALCLKAEAGIAARRPPHFLCFAKESKQRKATRSQGHFVVPCAARARGAPLNSLRSNRRGA